MHNGFLNMGGDAKMSKSLGNVMGVDELLAQGWHGEVLRLGLLSAHYRQPLEWNTSLLEQSQATLDGLYEAKRILKRAGDLKPTSEFVAALSDDLDFPAAIAEISRLGAMALRLRHESAHQQVGEVSDASLKSAGQYARKMLANANLVGLLNETSLAWRTGLRQKNASQHKKIRSISSILIKNRIAARTTARTAKNFSESDRIRDELAADGIVLEDGPGGTIWRRA
jgi:cysteinyl-tRNA synthetase